jgi:hypothetical protein
MKKNKENEKARRQLRKLKGEYGLNWRRVVEGSKEWWATPSLLG